MPFESGTTATGTNLAHGPSLSDEKKNFYFPFSLLTVVVVFNIDIGLPDITKLIPYTQFIFD